MKQKVGRSERSIPKSILIQPSDEAYHNVAVAHYNLGELEEASEFFLRVAGIRIISCIAM